MAFEKTVPVWNAPGAEPPASLKESGFQVGYKPPADYFNWFWHNVGLCLTELQKGAWAKQASVISAGSDLNEYTTLGTYTFSAASAAAIGNTPVSDFQCTMLVFPRLHEDDVANRVQVLITQNNRLFLRNLADGEWGEWGGVFMNNGEEGRLVPNDCTIITDWNDATKTGWFMGNNALNAPTTATGDLWYFGGVIAHSETYVLQEVYQFSASSDAAQIPKYIRAKKDGVWGEWVLVTVQRTVPRGAKLEYITNLTSDAQAQLDNKMPKNPNCIELTPGTSANTGGYIDFHYNGDTSDYTSRIIETEMGVLQTVSLLKASSNHQEASQYLVRNQKLKKYDNADSIETPSVPGQICWMYEGVN